MRRTLVTFMAAVVMTAPTVLAQEKPKAPEERKPTPHPALKVQVVISEYEGDRKISSLPYTLFLSDDHNRSIRMGLKVPVVVGSQDLVKLTQQVQYMDVGANIDCILRDMEGGRFGLELSVERSSLYSASSGKKPADWALGDAPLSSQPVIRTARMSSVFPIRDGETVQAIVSTDPVSGRVLKADVTANVVK